MGRRVWTRPVTEVQKFEANEYVAACGDKGTTYLFTCNAGYYGTLLGYKVYSNGNDGIPGTNDDRYLGNYTPCDATHEASTSDDFINGYMCKDFIIGQGKRIDVVIWRGESGHNIHCTTTLDKNYWETTKS